MALNVTPGTGATLATDEVGGAHYEYIKLKESAAASTTDLDKGTSTTYADGDSGLLALAVSNESAGALVLADNRYTPIAVDQSGRTMLSPEMAGADATKYLSVRLTDGSSFYSASGGGGGAGTEYTEGATDTTITGVAVMWEDASDTLRAVSAAKPLPVDGSGVTQPVSGTVTANLSATDNAVLDSIDASLAGALSVDDNSGSLTVDDGGGSLTVDGTVTANLSATDNAVLDTIAAAVHAEDTAHVSGDSGALALAVRNDAGTSLVSATGDYSPLGVDSNGNLLVNVAAGGGSGGTSATDDGAFTAGSGSGTPAMGFFSADTVDAGDVGVLAMDASRRLLVSIEADNVGIGGGTQYAEGSTQAAITGTAILWEDATDVVRAVSAAKPLPVDLGANNDVTVTSGNITADTELPTAAALADNAANPTAPAVGAFGMVWDGTTWDRAPGTSADGQLVNLGANNDVTVTGTVTVQDGGNVISVDDGAGSLTVDNAALSVTGGGTEASALRVTLANDSTGVLSVDDNGGSLTVDGTVGVSGTVTVDLGANNDIVGQVAHDAAVSGNPVLVAARANLNEPATAVADGDSTHLWADRWGRLVVVTGHPNPESPVSTNPTASGNNTVISAPGASVSLYIRRMSVHNSGASNITVLLQDGAGGTTRWAAELAAEGGGSVIDFGDRGWKLTANTLLNANLSAAGDVRVNVMDYYIAA